MKRSKGLTLRQEKHQLHELAEWLLEESVSYRQLNEFRQALRLSEDSFAALLGIAPATLAWWRSERRVPLGNRDAFHGKVAEAELSDGSLGSFLQNHRFEAKLEGPTIGIVASSVTSDPGDLSSRIPWDQRTLEREAEGLERRGRFLTRDAAAAYVRKQHEGAGAPCECSVCTSA